MERSRRRATIIWVPISGSLSVTSRPFATGIRIVRPSSIGRRVRSPPPDSFSGQVANSFIDPLRYFFVEHILLVSTLWVLRLIIGSMA